jgi:pimeloyl-ACP methyl ester carboxylesterase
MKRILWLTILALAIGTTGAGAGYNPFKPRPAARATAPSPCEHRTYCVGWVDPASKSLGSLARPLVWIVDGAGDLRGCSNAFNASNALMGEPVETNVFLWSHGYRRLLLDQIGTTHARSQGLRLAREILERKMNEPGRRVVLVAHSAGCAVALAACEQLPIDAVDRVLLLAPSVSTSYDIRPTLWSAKEGVDVFCSKKDWVALGFVVRVVGTTDNFWSGSAAGRFGFKPKKPNALADAEQARLRQHFWSEDVAWTGHTGGHHGMHEPAFLQTFLMPLLVGK